MDPNNQENNQTDQNITPQIQQTQPTQPTPGYAMPPPPAGEPPSSFFSKLKQKRAKTAVIITLVVLFLLGASAAAYFGVVVPNKPQNVVKKVISNTLKQEKVSGKGSANFTGKDSLAVIVNYSLQGDSTINASAGQIDLSVSGVKIPFEYRAVNKALYLKLGDLSTIESLVSGFAGPEAAPYINDLATKLSNKWIEFDESLLKSYTSNNCSLLENKISEQDINKFLELYDKNMFINVESTSKDTIDGKSVTKAELGLDKEKAKAFGKELEQVEFLKKLNECGGEDSKTTESAAEEFKGDASFTIWIDKGKNLVKIALKVTDEEGTFEADFTLNDEKVDIQKPEGATPAMQILGELGPLFGGFGAAGAAGTNTDDQAALECAQAYQASPDMPLSAECQTLLGIN